MRLTRRNGDLTPRRQLRGVTEGQCFRFSRWRHSQTLQCVFSVGVVQVQDLVAFRILRRARCHRGWSQGVRGLAKGDL